jgi:hypothetical protein
MLKKVVFCSMVCWFFSNVAMERDISDSDSDGEIILKDVTIAWPGRPTQNIKIGVKEIAKMSLISGWQHAIVWDNGTIELPSFLGEPVVRKSLELAKKLQISLSRHEFLTMEQLKAFIAPDEIAQVLHVLLRLSAQTNLCVAVGLLATDPAYAEFLQKRLSADGALATELTRKMKHTLPLFDRALRKKKAEKFVPAKAFDYLTRLTELWKRHDFCIKRPLVDAETQVEPTAIPVDVRTEKTSLTDREMQTDAMLAASPKTASTAQETQTECACVCADAQTESVIPADHVTQTEVALVSAEVQTATVVPADGGVQTECACVCADAQTERVIPADHVTQTEIALTSAEAQTATVVPADGIVQTECACACADAQTESVVLADHVTQTEIALASADVQTATVVPADGVVQTECACACADAQTESVVSADHVTQTEVALASAEVQTATVVPADGVVQTECACACADTQTETVIPADLAEKPENQAQSSKKLKSTIDYDTVALPRCSRINNAVQRWLKSLFLPDYSGTM